MLTHRHHVSLVLAAAFAVSAGCGKSGAAPAPAAAPAKLDCAAFAERMTSCTEEFWQAYAGTKMAKNNAIDGATAGHVAEVRAGYQALGYAAFCANMADIYETNPRWAPRVQGCAAEASCASWAACAAPALTSAATAR